MYNEYLRIMELLLKIAPLVFEGGKLVLKGGTAINLFVNNFPRVSVDIDCVYNNWHLKRTEALDDIEGEIERINRSIPKLGLIVKSKQKDKISVSNSECIVKIEINTIMRGTLLCPNVLQVCSALRKQIPWTDYSIPVLNRDELYAGKLVAALDRQHPRDLFDVHYLMRSGGFTEQMLDCFAIYLSAHNRPMHELLIGHDLSIETLYKNNFVGMANENISLEELIETRKELRKNIVNLLGKRRSAFLHQMVACEPDWSLIPFEHVADLPAIQWKLQNLRRLQKRNPGKFRQQLETLDFVLGMD